MDEFLLVARATFKDALCQLCNSWCNGVCPRVIEAEFGSGFFCGDFCWRFDGGAQGIAKYAGIFPVSVIDAPQFVVGIYD